MKILQISPNFPFPPDDGGRVAVYNMTRQFLRKGFTLHFAAPKTNEMVPAAFLNGLTIHQLDIEPVYTLIGAFKNLFSKLPYNIEKYLSSRASRQLRSIVEVESFDLILVEFVNLAPYGVQIKTYFDGPIVLREHNFQADILRQLRDQTSNPLLRAYANMQYRRLVKLEAKAVREFDAVVPISEVDAIKLREIAPGIVTIPISAGVDVTQFELCKEHRENSVLLFTNYDWFPNRDSFDFYRRKILPLLETNSPGVKTLVAGKHTEKIQKHKRKNGIEVLGYVANLNELSRKSSIAVVPLRVGSGVRIKLLEMMAMGFAIVSTPIGAEGLPVKHNEHLILAEEPEAIAESLTFLLRSPEDCRRIGANARKFVEERFSWNSAGDQFSYLFHQLIAERKRQLTVK